MKSLFINNDRFVSVTKAMDSMIFRFVCFKVIKSWCSWILALRQVRGMVKRSQVILKEDPEDQDTEAAQENKEQRNGSMTNTRDQTHGFMKNERNMGSKG